MMEREETFGEVIAEMNWAHDANVSTDAVGIASYASRLKAAHEREIASNEAERFRIECECIELRDQMSVKDAEIARLKAEVGECGGGLLRGQDEEAVMSVGHARPLTCCDRYCAGANGCRMGVYQCRVCGRWYCGDDMHDVEHCLDCW